MKPKNAKLLSEIISPAFIAIDTAVERLLHVEIKDDDLGEDMLHSVKSSITLMYDMLVGLLSACDDIADSDESALGREEDRLEVTENAFKEIIDEVVEAWVNRQPKIVN